MKLDEINVFDSGMPGGGQEQNDDEEKKVADFLESDDDGLDCPILGILENMYIEPHPYGITLSISGVEKIMKALGYNIIERGGEKYALLGSEKLSRSEKKRSSQKLLEVYGSLAEDLAVAKFVKDWNDVFGSAGNTGEA